MLLNLFLVQLLHDIIFLLLDDVIVENDDQLIEKLGVVQIDLRKLRELLLLKWLLLLLHWKDWSLLLLLLQALQQRHQVGDGICRRDRLDLLRQRR